MPATNLVRSSLGQIITLDGQSAQQQRAPKCYPYQGHTPTLRMDT